MKSRLILAIFCVTVSVTIFPESARAATCQVPNGGTRYWGEGDAWSVSPMTTNDHANFTPGLTQTVICDGKDEGPGPGIFNCNSLSMGRGEGGTGNCTSFLYCVAGHQKLFVRDTGFIGHPTAGGSNIQATVYHESGTNVFNHWLLIGVYDAPLDTYSMSNDAVVLCDGYYVGAYGQFLVAGGKVLPHDDLAYGDPFENRCEVQCPAIQGAGLLQGWCTNWNVTGRLLNNGRIVADGSGTARDLALTSHNAVTNSTDNPTTGSNGWYAVDKGRLMLPPRTVGAAGGTVCWGESDTDPTNDLVNSVKVDFVDAGGGGTLTGMLYAVDRADIPAGLTDAISVHYLTYSGFPVEFDMAIRYDHVLAGASEADLILLYSDGGAWTDIGASVDQTHKLITASGLTSFSWFAVQVETGGGPAPVGSLIWVS